MAKITYPSLYDLESNLNYIRQSPKECGQVQLIVRRPRTDEREILTEAVFDPEKGLVGDNWQARGSRRTDDGSAHPDMQISLMNARVISLLSEDPRDWALAGDQLFVDLDLSADNLPPGTQLSIGSALLEVTAQPHTGCHKFSDRFGQDAVRFVNSRQHRDLQLRGIYARVVKEGKVQTGDEIRKV